MFFTAQIILLNILFSTAVSGATTMAPVFIQLRVLSWQRNGPARRTRTVSPIAMNWILSILNLNTPEYNILNWLALLTRYRSYWQTGSIAEEAKNYLQEHFFVDPTPYDIIIGYRADDSYFSFAQDFVAGTISLKKLSEAMRLGKLGEQVVLKSQKAYDQIRFLDAEPADAKIYYERKAMRDRDARREYRKTKGAADSLSELYMLDIMREGITNGDPRLR